MRLAFPGLSAALASGATVITPTPLLASVAVEQFNREQLATGKFSWERPPIFNLEAWMADCWQQARFAVANAPLLLSALQQRELWRQIIQQDRPDLFDVNAMAGMAQRASRILAEYQIPTTGAAWLEHADAAKFLRWHEAFQHKLDGENWITRSELWRLLPHWISKGAVNPGRPVFAGLSSVSPGLKTLARAIGDAVELVGITASYPPAMAAASRHESITAEFESVARSVRHVLEAKPQTSVGVLVADLAAHSRDLIRIFHDVLNPALPSDEHIHLQSGKLMASPIISNALLLLELAKSRIHYASAGAILRSPFIDGAREERSARAMADGALRRARELDFSAAEIEKAVWDCPILFQVLRRISKISKKLPAKMRPAAWSAAFSDILEAAKWPAIENLTEAERRIVDQWSAALSELASLGLVSAPISLKEALQHLQSILNRAAEIGDWSSPIQIIDADASEGIEFDHLFLANVCEEAWPALVKLSPLIPYRLQRLHQIPASDPASASEERYRKRDVLLSSAGCLSVCYTGTLSPLIRPHTFASQEPLIWSGLTPNQSYAPAELECQNDGQAPPLQQVGQVLGGASLIKAQSLCPFKAFAEYRLNARADNEACFGFDALERGECAHRALEYVWTELRSQQRLKALSPDELDELVNKHVNQAVQDDPDNGPIRTLTSMAERERLVVVITQWLKIERDRAGSFVVERLEDERSVEISGLSFKLRMDRVDRLANGNLVLIDYKSGKQSADRLVGERPAEPQLLVYASTMEEPIDGIYFGELRNRNARPVGLGAAKHFPKQRGTKQPDRWQDFLAASRSAVHELATEYKDGEAGVTPQSGACAYCRLPPICRVDAVAVADEDDD